MRLLLLSILAVLSLSACGVLPSPLATSNKSASTLKSAASALVINGKTLSLKVSAWTSNGVGINPNPFIVLVNVESSDGAVPADIIPKRLYIIKGEQVWETGFTNENRGPYAPLSEKVARTSNRFPDGTTLNFAVDLATPQGKQLLRAARDQVITSPQ
ncbi:hypothetical protein [Deinococcus alpinitundrae]|uniref:hypothetical protein n=1 Tax=Deinococcus alpinitundrae TaxID=468913 RepID=UPI001379B1E6|nr:hypothetical protein [Deinococcus alpinitundrae]